MKTVIDNIHEIIINKSRFICLIYNIQDVLLVPSKLEEIKNKYVGATHYCYAYIINNHEKSSDDGEPSGTAGLPILNVLKKEHLDDVLCVVVRYFGGIKLGAGGLIRAYSKACKESLIITTLKEGYIIELTFNYNNIREIDYLINETIIIYKKFDLNPSYKIKITKEKYEQISKRLNTLSNIKIIDSIYI